MHHNIINLLLENEQARHLETARVIVMVVVTDHKREFFVLGYQNLRMQMQAVLYEALMRIPR